MYRGLKDRLSNKWGQIKSDARYNVVGKEIQLMMEKDLGDVIKDLQFPEDWRDVLNERLRNEYQRKY
ncbi:hypothetical protein HOD38_01575 [archaeon]|jgi:hypothetical protein|nr:hypothetical protein [archaeon]MBT4396935.1 hypothetical protein [archaeon]MBT4440926.1 hypothetical protein [archaeon]